MAMKRAIGMVLFAAAGMMLAGCAHRATAPAPPAASAATFVDPAVATMPTGTGKAKVVQVCGGCHTLARVVRQHQTRAQWDATIAQMKDNGLFASPADLNTILTYLVAHYGPPQP
ncbi:MAG: hypothetical protein ACRD1Y_06650 [Terriglobales bacterium]